MKRIFAASLVLVAFYAGTASAEVSCEYWSTDPKRFFTEATAEDVSRCISTGAEARTSYAGIRSGAQTALHSASTYTSDSRVIPVLLEAGARLEPRMNKGYTPLHVAAVLNANPEVITALLNAGADLQARTHAGDTPLILAADRSNSADVVLTLIEAGADLDARNKKGTTAARKARYNRALRDSRAARLLATSQKQRRHGSTATLSSPSGPAAEQMQALRKRRAEAAERQRAAEAKLHAAEEEARLREVRKRAEERRQREKRRLDRLEQRAAQLQTERHHCEPKLDAASFFGSLLNKDRVIENLQGFQLPAAPSYVTAIPFLLAGQTERPDVYAAVYQRILNHIDAFIDAQLAGREPGPYVDDWFESVSAFRDNCLFDLADYLVLEIMPHDSPSIKIALGHRDNDLADPLHLRAYALLEAIPPQLLRHIYEVGDYPDESGTFQKFAELVNEKKRTDFVYNTCMSYFSEQAKLREGVELTDLQREQFTILCNCFYAGIAHPEDFSLIFSVEHALSKRRLDAVQVLGNCAIKHGLNTNK